jgi:hypothetical protein
MKQPTYARNRNTGHSFAQVAVVSQESPPRRGSP